MRRERIVPEPLADTQRIVDIPDCAGREAELAKIPQPRRDMVSHFLVLALAKRVQVAAAQRLHHEELATVPASVRDDVRRLAKSYLQAAEALGSFNETKARKNMEE